MTDNTNLMSQIETNFQLTTTDLVAGLVSKWEGKLYALKDELSLQISSITKSISLLETTIVDEMRAVWNEQYKYLLDLPQATVSFKKPAILWQSEYDTKHQFSVRVEVAIDFDLGATTTYSSMHSTTITPIKQSDITNYQTLVTERTALNDRLMAVMVEIKSVSRKERELKAALVEQKMAQLGIDNPFENEQLLRLLEVKI